MTDLRRFDKEDWYAFAGAECFSNGSQPFIYERELIGKVYFTIIADRTGIEIYLTGEDEQDVWSKGIKNFTPLRAQGELGHLISYLNKYGYAPDIAYELDHPSNTVVDGFEYC